MYNNWYMLCFLVDCLLVGLVFHPNVANRQSTKKHNIYQLLYIQGVPGGMDKTSGECSLC